MSPCQALAALFPPMRWSNLFIPTLREDPAEAEVVSHKLLLRAGYIRQLSPPAFTATCSWPSGRCKIIAIVREEMDAIGAQEMLLPALHPAEVWQESGRWDVMGDNMFRLKDRFQRELCLGMTHEENMTAIARGRVAQLQATAADLVSDPDQVPR
jgi:prolyl-tRNA synthetase